ncbi:MAG TPA: TraB/GumN family protein, partial [Chthoniobacteraceae bacterium]|nr:TraB/GumN family protein [Chthoniobacteraceae bacterium]
DQLKAVTALMGMESLSDVLPKDLYERSEAEVQRINPALNLKPFEKMKIWGLAMTIAMLEEQLKNPGGMPLDMVLFMKAKDAGKEVGGIETFEEQTGVFDAFSKEEQIAMLRATLDDMDRARKEGKSPLDELRTAYLSGDLQVLDRTMNEWMTGLDQKLLARFMDSLLTRRNHIMADRISAKLKATPEKSFFFAVGAGHLPGEEGILKLLEKQGLKLTRATEAP